MDIRRIVTERMETLPPPEKYNWRCSRPRPSKITANYLAKIANLPARTVYNYVNDINEINADALGYILDALELEITPKKKPQGIGPAV